MPLHRSPVAAWGAPDYSGGGTGRWFLPVTGSEIAGSGIGSMFFAPLDVGGDCIVEAVACQVTTGTATAVIRLGLYSGEFEATTLVADWGTVDASSTGVKSITGLSTAITPGRYWFGAVIQVAAAEMLTIWTVPNVASFAPWKATAAWLSATTGLRMDGVTGALPSSTSGFTVSEKYAAIGVRFA